MKKPITIIYKELIRINPENSAELQWKSTAMGHHWHHKFTSIDMGNFQTLEFNEQSMVLIAITDIGKYYSTNGGRHFIQWDEE